MLSPADVVTAKLLVQTQAATPDQVRAAMRALARTPAGGSDLVGHLQIHGVLAPPAAAKVRRYQALFEHVRLEGVFLRLAEKHDPPIDRMAVAEVLARIERESYRSRVGEVLVRMGKLSPDAARDLERRTRSKLQKEDLKVLERYAAEDFAGVARPLLPVERIETGVFKVSTLFRGKETRRTIKRLSSQLVDFETPVGVADLLPDFDDDGEEELSQEAQEEHARRSTSRLRGAGGEGGGGGGGEPSLDQRRQIANYHVVECVGQGGMGAVYLAQEEGMGPMSAVKVMLAGRAAPEDLARFEREIELMGRIDHPRVVRVLDQGTTDDGLRYVAMPFYAGKDLKTVLADGPLELEAALDLADQVLDALDGVHRAEVVHRDLKPENVFVLAGQGGEIRLVDFGIARLRAGTGRSVFQSSAGVISGSPAYVAPETITGEAIDGRTDLYSFGVMLFLLLARRFPLFAESPYDYLREHLVGVPLTLSQGKKDVAWDEDLEALMASLLAKDPADRPASAADVRQRLAAGRARIVERAAAPLQPVNESQSFFNRFFKR